MNPNSNFARGGHAIDPDKVSAVKRKLFDIPYAAGSPSQILDLWYPNEEREEPYPVVIHVHGGGFRVGGHREDSLEPMMSALDRGYVLVSVEYRKSEEARFPAMIYDLKTAIRFLKAHAEEYQLDPNRFVLWGPSSGGWLVSITALTEGNQAFEDLSMGYPDEDAKVAGVVDWCGPCGRFDQMDAELKASGKGPGPEEHDLPGSSESTFMGCAVTEIPELVRMASPCTYVHKDMPPFLIVHGTEDVVVPTQQSVIFADAIEKAGGSVEFILAEGAPHHGRVWWHEPYAAKVSLDFIDKVLNDRD